MSSFLQNIDQIHKRLSDINNMLVAPETFKNNELLLSLSREHQNLTKIINLYNKVENLKKQQCELKHELVTETDEELLSLANQEIDETDEKLKLANHEFLLSMIPEDLNDSRNTIFEIRAGTGGDEASLFAGDLFRMYTRFSEQQHLNLEVLSSHPSDGGGFKEIIFLICGDNVYKLLKFEGGGHRVQRVPTTEANGRIHTSSATIAVLPEAKDVDINIKPEELEITICRASGPGGQCVNKTESAVQILHKPTGMIVVCADERSQQKNRVKAMQVLMSRLLKKRKDEEAQKYSNDRKLQIGTGDRSDRIRTYNFPQNRVTDHRIGLTLYNLDDVMDGNLMPFITALQKADEEERLSELLDKND